MEITLVLVTLVSLALAVGMGALLWRLLQEERRRTDARVAALVEGYAQRSTAVAASPAGSSAPSADPASPVSAAPVPSAAVAIHRDALALGAEDAVDRDWLLEFPSAAPDGTRPTIAHPTSAAAPATPPLARERAGGSLFTPPPAFGATSTSPTLGAADAVGPPRPADDPGDRATWTRPFIETPETLPLGTSVAARAAVDDEIDLPLASDSARVLFGQVEQADRAADASRHTMFAVGAALLIGLMLAIWTVTHLVITFATPAAVAASATNGGLVYGSGGHGDAKGNGTTRANAGDGGATNAGAAGNDATGASGMNGGSTGSGAARGGGTGATNGDAVTSGGDAGLTGTGVPLELLTLQPTQGDGTVTVRGLVRNPPNGATQERLVAVVFFFNQRGDLLASVRAPLDFRVLAPGDESPFQVSTPAQAGVSRFRVSFRRDTSAGAAVSGPFDAARAATADIVPHVDRRQPAGS